MGVRATRSVSRHHVGSGGVVDRHQSKYIKTFNLEKLRVYLIFISVE